jgi:hypothetical protein
MLRPAGQLAQQLVERLRPAILRRRRQPGGARVPRRGRPVVDRRAKMRGPGGSARAIERPVVHPRPQCGMVGRDSRRVFHSMIRHRSRWGLRPTIGQRRRRTVRPMIGQRGRRAMRPVIGRGSRQL